jgi:hypothetical protein
MLTDFLLQHLFRNVTDNRVVRNPVKLTWTCQATLHSGTGKGKCLFSRTTRTFLINVGTSIAMRGIVNPSTLIYFHLPQCSLRAAL